MTISISNIRTMKKLRGGAWDNSRQSEIQAHQVSKATLISFFFFIRDSITMECAPNGGTANPSLTMLLIAKSTLHIRPVRVRFCFLAADTNETAYVIGKSIFLLLREYPDYHNFGLKAIDPQVTPGFPPSPFRWRGAIPRLIAAGQSSVRNWSNTKGLRHAYYTLHKIFGHVDTLLIIYGDRCKEKK